MVMCSLNGNVLRSLHSSAGEVNENLREWLTRTSRCSAGTPVFSAKASLSRRLAGSG